MVLITILTGVYKPTYNWGAPLCMEIFYRNFPMNFPHFAAKKFPPEAPGSTRASPAARRRRRPRPRPAGRGRWSPRPTPGAPIVGYHGDTLW
jgi:hypothetical protein